MAGRRLDISDWMASQSKDYEPSSLDRYLSHPDNPSPSSATGPSPRWEEHYSSSNGGNGSNQNSTCSSSYTNPNSSAPYMLSPALLKQISQQYSKGEMVAVRCNRHKWLLGEVRGVMARGIRVWVGEAGLLVNVPRQLLSTHLIKMSSVEGLHSLPPAESMIPTATIETPKTGRMLVQCVRPAHLSHRQLYASSASRMNMGSGSSKIENDQIGSNECAICGESVILEDEAVAPWDCDHNCHIDCIQNKPRFFSTTTCPVCKDLSSTASSVSPSSPLARQIRSSTSNDQSDQTAAAAGRNSHSIDENSQEQRGSGARPLKSALRKQSVSFSDDSSRKEEQISSAAPAPQTTIASSSAPSLADRMKKFSMTKGNLAINPNSDQQQQQQSGDASWLTVIRNGQNTRQTASQQRIEHMARAKENTFSAKAKQQQQQQQRGM